MSVTEPRECIRTSAAPDGATILVAVVRIGATTVEMIGAGDGLVAAYGDLHRHLAQPLLEGAFRDYLSSRGARG